MGEVPGADETAVDVSRRLRGAGPFTRQVLGERAGREALLRTVEDTDEAQRKATADAVGLLAGIAGVALQNLLNRQEAIAYLMLAAERVAAKLLSVPRGDALMRAADAIVVGAATAADVLLADRGDEGKVQ